MKNRNPVILVIDDEKPVRDSHCQENRTYQESLEEELAKRTKELDQNNLELQQVNVRLRKIVEAIKSFSGCGQVAQLGTRLLEEFADQMLACGGSLYLVEDHGLRLIHALDPLHASGFIPFPLREGSILGCTLNEGKPMLIHDVDNLHKFSSSGWKGYRDGSVLVFPLLDEKGNVFGVLSLHNKTCPPFVDQDRDIGAILASYSCEAFRATRAMEISHWQSQALEQSLDGIAITDMDGNLMFVNRAWAAMHGHNIQALQGKNMAMFHTEGQIEKELTPFIEKTRLKGWHEAEIGHVTKDGVIFPTRMSNTILRDEESGAIGMIGIARDITEKMNLEAQLRQAQKMESIGRLAGGVAHDFNNLLTPILGYTGMLLLDLSPDDPRYDKLMQIQKAGERGESLARQLLAFSRKQILEIKKVDLCQVVSGFEKILRSTIREDIELVVKTAPLPCHIKADIAQLEHMLMNLLVNAQDAMPDGGLIVIETSERILNRSCARAHPGIQPGPYVILTIRDTGCGMDSETLKHLFEPFFTTKERGKGTGLGLSTAYGIIQHYGGHIWADSILGQETTVTICFPCADEISGHATVHPGQKEIRNGNETVLVVEDDESVRSLVSSILKRQSYQVVDAENADECLRIAKHHKGAVHLLITDVVMPRMNGRELYERLAPMFPDLKVLYMSGYADDVIGYHGVLEAAGHFLQKPISVHTLTGKVRAVLDG